MSITNVRYLSSASLADLQTQVNALLGTHQPEGTPYVPPYLSNPAVFVQKMVSTGSVAGSQLFNSGALAIKTGGSALVKTAATIYGSIGAALVTKAAADMAALSGSVANAKFNVFAFMVDAAGTLSSAMGTEGATLAAVVFPTIPTTKILIGFVIINPTGTGAFVGGTTALDDATVVPTAVYVNTVGQFLQPA